MEDKALITEAYQLLSELNKSYQSCKQGAADDFRLQELLNSTLKELKKAEKLDNSILIDLEKFYQRTSLLIGLGSLKLNDQARNAWRNYDKFHYEHVKHVLTLYGPVFGFWYSSKISSNHVSFALPYPSIAFGSLPSLLFDFH